MKRKSSETEAVVREIKRKTRTKYSSEEKIRIVLEGLIGEAVRCLSVPVATKSISRISP